VLIAEGSDWFWWYGDDHSSEHDLEFDELFRRHLRNAYSLLQRPVPDELFVTNISQGTITVRYTDPTAFLTPTIDGEETSYFEWLGAGEWQVREVAGAMHRADARPPLIELVRFGFNHHHLFLRLDASRPISELLATGYEFSLKFLKPDGLRFSVLARGGQTRSRFWDRLPEPPQWIERDAGWAQVGVGAVLELALPLSEIGPAGSISFFVAVYEANLEIERHPANRPIDIPVPSSRFEALNWTA
jgi:hypothetical protein